MWTLLSVIVFMIVAAMIRDARRDGMMETKRAVAEFCVFLASLGVLGGLAWWLADVVAPNQQVAGAVLFFVVGALFIQVGLHGLNHRRQAKRVRRNGVLTAREFNRRSDAILARVQAAK